MSAARWSLAAGLGSRPKDIRNQLGIEIGQLLQIFASCGVHVHEIWGVGSKHLDQVVGHWLDFFGEDRRVALNHV